MQNYQYEHRLELLKYPIEYTVNMAIVNNNVIKYGVLPFNAKRMQTFMYNYIHQIPDKIVITDYGIGGYPTISILQYDGNTIIYTERSVRSDNKFNFQTFYGDSMNEKYRKSGNKLIRDYNLVTLNNFEIPVFRELLSST